MTQVSIKFKRTWSDASGVYGPEIKTKLDDLVGGANKWQSRAGHSAASVGSSGSEIELHEDGPEWILLALTLLPAYTSAIAALIVLWRDRRKANPQDESRIYMKTDDGREYKGPLKTQKDIELAEAFLKSLQQRR